MSRAEEDVGFRQHTMISNREVAVSKHTIMPRNNRALFIVIQTKALFPHPYVLLLASPSKLFRLLLAGYLDRCYCSPGDDSELHNNVRKMHVRFRALQALENIDCEPGCSSSLEQDTRLFPQILWYTRA